MKHVYLQLRYIYDEVPLLLQRQSSNYSEPEACGQMVVTHCFSEHIFQVMCYTTISSRQSAAESLPAAAVGQCCDCMLFLRAIKSRDKESMLAPWRIV